MQAVTSAAEVKSVLNYIRDSGEDPYRFYCALLHTRQPGLDSELREHIVEQWETLDELTGANTLVFAFSEFEPQPKVGALAREFDVPADQLPCAVLFCDPLISGRRIVFPFADVLPPRGQRHGEHIAAAFKLIIASLDAAQDGPGRLERLGTELNQRLEPFVAETRPAAPKPPGKTWVRIRDGTMVFTALVAVGAWQKPKAPPPTPTPNPPAHIEPATPQAAEPAVESTTKRIPSDVFPPVAGPVASGNPLASIDRTAARRLRRLFARDRQRRPPGT